MEKIILHKIIKDNNSITYDFSVSDGLSKYFSDKPFIIEYSEDISSVPDSIAAVPFVCNVLPIIWLTDSELILKEIDKAFIECIPDVKRGYETIFPESTFAGKITAQKIVVCEITPVDNCALMFSGGLDAVSSLVTHLNECPDLISIWGSDIRFENDEGWNVVYKGIREYSEKFNLNEVIIRSRFRDFDCEDILNRDYNRQLQNGWWHGVKHALALLGHIAPCAYLKGYSKLYIASSNCPADGIIRIASSPLTDNYVRFANCIIVHDGYENSRQDKVRNVVRFSDNSKNKISLHVCWESQEGSNCCKCEKCYRTMAGIIAEGADPVDYGFAHSSETVPFMRHELIELKKLSPDVAQRHWIHVHNGAVKNLSVIKKQPYWKYMRWIVESDFSHPETIKPSLRFRIGEKLSTFGFYKFLHRVKTAILK